MRRLVHNSRVRILAAAAFLGACASATQSSSRDTISFSHHVHTEQGLACGDCHAAVAEDAEKKSAEERPKMGECAACHDVQNKAECGKCHTNAAAPATYVALPETHLLFSHQRHADRTGDCADCHAKAASSPQISAKNRLLPAHVECNTCHQKDVDAGKCRLCHDRLDLHGDKPKSVHSHESGFFERHGQKAAAGNQDQCAECHDQSFCGDCHARTMTAVPAQRFPERVDGARLHEGNWISKHVLEARTGDSSCMKCHGSSFCAACHERSGVGGATAERSPHPRTWMQPGTGPDNHGHAARRRIAECASCHDQGPASICVGCHKSGGVNPHPPGGRPAIEKSDRASHEMCSICHVN